MKKVLLAVAVVTLAWFGLSQVKDSLLQAPPANVAPVVQTTPVVSADVTPPGLAPLLPPPRLEPVVATAPTVSLRTAPERTPQSSAPVYPPPKPWLRVDSPVVEPTRPAGPPPPLPQIVLNDVLGPNNSYHDGTMGVSATYPEGWSVREAGRWGLNNTENTVFFSTDVPGINQSSMYYQRHPEGYPEIEGPEAYFRRVAQNKENQRVTGGVRDYKNVQDSYALTEINGQPTFSYYAVYTRQNQVMTEYFVRTLGKDGYVMFFTMGTAEAVQAAKAKVDKMAASVRVR